MKLLQRTTKDKERIEWHRMMIYYAELRSTLTA